MTTNIKNLSSLSLFCGVNKIKKGAICQKKLLQKSAII